jgi:hypothetical protein
MAITRAQQFRQMFKKGEGPAGGATIGSGSAQSGSPSRSGGNGRGRDTDFQQRGMSKADYDRAVSRGDVGQNFSARPNTLKKIQDKAQTLSLKNLYDQKIGIKKAIPSFSNILTSFTPGLAKYEPTDPDLDLYGMSGEDLTDIDRLAESINKSQTVGLTRDEYLDAFYGPDNNNPNDPRNQKKEGDGQQFIFPQRLQAPAPSITKKEEPFVPNFRLLAGGGMAERAPYEGGIMDLESARQMYGLGKLVKKVTKTVKKIAKSPIGKAAILGAGAYYGLGAFPAFKALTPLKQAGIIAGGLLTLSPFFMKQKQEDIIPEEGADIDDPQTIMANAFKYQNIRTMAEGGSTEKEPVAKKTMPLLDMGGMEKDYREDGGFVPIGRMEKADDVPARLSKNEFVFTADAVRNAGDGNVDKGAEVMYNMMKNLEAGGEVSEESQGLEGAKKMFQTSQRLGEVV